MERAIVSDIFRRMRQAEPLVHQITNWVTIGDCATVTRAFGALPVMAHAREEAADMASIASALVLNIGTLTNEVVEAMILAAARANERNIPVVLDAVGVGATQLRNDKAAEILGAARIDIVKGNVSEIARLAGEDVMTRGVEATDVSVRADAVAEMLAAARKATVVITGVTDVVSDGSATYHIANGHPLMGAVVGTGCMAAPVIAAFSSTANGSDGPGSFKGRFFDAIYNLDRDTVERMVRIDET